MSDYVLLLHNAKFSMPLRLSFQCQLKKTSYDVSAINNSLSHCNKMQSITFFLSYFDRHVSEKIFHTVISIIKNSITCGIFVMNLKINTKSWDSDVKG